MTNNGIILALMLVSICAVNAVSDGPWNCDFDTDLCSFTQSTDDDFDWGRNNMASQPDTGPEADHTVGIPGGSGYFAYVDSSHPQKKGDTAKLMSGQAGFVGKACLTFWYLMWGTYADTLSVYMAQPNGAVYELWTHERSLDREWYQANITMDFAVDKTQIYFQATIGGERSDIAIDDVEVVIGQECIAGELADKLCDFEDSAECRYIQDRTDDFNWIQNDGGTSSTNTGPTFDHTYGTTYGRYMYIETSAPQTEGEVARIISPNQKSTSKAPNYCVTWYYHMFGTDTGKLNVYYVKGGNVTGDEDYMDRRELIWSREGNQGNNWYVARVKVEALYTYQLVFEGVVGAGSSGDIAIDDIETDRSGESKPCDPLGSCKFEHGSCYYENEVTDTDDFDWQIACGKDTGPLGVGPVIDHTYGETEGKFMFAYFGAPLGPGNTAILKIDRITPQDINGYDACFSFWYHMQGEGIGTLSVNVTQDDANLPDEDSEKVTDLVWSLSGDQGSEWKQAQVRVSSPVEFSMVFTATVGSSSDRAIAIDDVLLVPTTGSCDFAPDQAKPDNNGGNSANIVTTVSHSLLLVLSVLAMMVFS